MILYEVCWNSNSKKQSIRMILYLIIYLKECLDQASIFQTDKNHII